MYAGGLTTDGAEWRSRQVNRGIETCSNLDGCPDKDGRRLWFYPGGRKH